jgi:thiol-disulfide isomerase/thioredoxin
MTRHELEAIRENSESVESYIRSSKEKAPQFAERKSIYTLDEETVEEIRDHTGKVAVVAFSAEWCPDCHRNIPVLCLLNEATGMEVRVFGHLMRDAKNPEEMWRVPPSPPEVKEFNVVKIPLILVLNEHGETIGAIVENPPEGQTLEEALLEILKTI